ncbi:family 43 glycosylhydrolase [Streptomyces sp. 1222.5]|uniref:family 43 glycosylhydrolase n=1 Tax=Streptomyces sp. 1222.5 TaxID=1881026 RepID=UPI003D71970C
MFIPLLAVIAGVLVAPAESAATVEFQTTVVNFDASGNQVTWYDTAGHAIDAHDGMVSMFNGTYFLYGTSYDCGYQWGANPTFCGFKVYSSPDLTHWTDKGYAVSGSPCSSCFRPHVIYNASSRKYVMWANAGSGYQVYTSTTPTGPFNGAGFTMLSVSSGQSAGDESLFVDSDQVAYIAYTVTKLSTNEHTQRIEKLNSQYTGGTGNFIDIPNTGAKPYPAYGTEAPSLFKRGDTYYSVLGSTCPYCSGTATLYATASGPLGAWSSYRQLNGNSCGGQPSFVFPVTEGTSTPDYPTTTTFLYGSDLWHAGANGGLQSNQALAHYYWAPLSFDDTESPPTIEAFSCRNSVAIALPAGSPGARSPIAGGIDQTSSADGFHAWCDISKDTVRRRQTFVARRSGVLDRVGIIAFQRNQLSSSDVNFPITGQPNAPLFVDVLDISSGRTLSSVQAADAHTLGWSPRTVTVMPNVEVTEGRTYALVVRSETTKGCYGIAFSDNEPYPDGTEAYSSNAGATYTVETKRALQFWTTEGPSASTFCTAAEAAVCNFSGTQQIAYGADGNYITKTLTGPAVCKLSTFGSDPAPGVVKACYVKKVGPPGKVLCASGESLPSYAGGVCNYNGTQQVAYGADGNYITKTLTGPAVCKLSTFGSDPAPGVVKACYVQPLTAGPPAGYTLCASAEHGTCTFAGMQNVAFGANGDYTYKTMTGPVACNLAAFDNIDPAYGTVKSCYVGPPFAP